MMESHYEERQPTAELAEYVESVWCQQVAGGAEAYAQRVLPDGCVDALWRDGLLCVAGPDTRWHLEELPAGSFIVGVRLRPGTAPLLFGDVPVSEACDQQIDLSELWDPRVVRELTERLHQAASPWKVAAVLESAVRDRLRVSAEIDPMVQQAIDIFDSPEPDPVASVAARFGLSERQFRRRFVAAVGYGPKTLEGVFRLRRAIRLAESAVSGGLGRNAVAFNAGYADQSHMAREVRRLAGITPSELSLR